MANNNHAPTKSIQPIAATRLRLSFSLTENFHEFQNNNFREWEIYYWKSLEPVE